MKNALFIHFINRELFRSLGMTSIKGVNYAVKILLLTKDMDVYIPLSSVWENLTATDLDLDFWNIVDRCNQISFVSDCVTHEEFLDKNQALYFYDKERYACYFYNNSEFIKPRTTLIKSSGTTQEIRNGLQEWKTAETLSIPLLPRDKNIVEYNKLLINGVIEKSNGEGITKSLFINKLDKTVYELSVARLLSGYYIKNYLEFMDGDIATGINKYLSYYDIYANDFPYNDIVILETILECVGVDHYVFTKENNCDWESFFEKRRKSQHQRICKQINEIIQVCLEELNFGKGVAFKQVTNEICSKIRRNSVKCLYKNVYIFSINQLDALENNLHQLYCKLQQDSEHIWSYLLPEGRKVMTMKNKVFVVHGHNQLFEEKLTSWLYSVDLEPVVLHKMANGGITSIISKIEKYSDVSCAMVLFTADDTGKGVKEKEYKKRARQNAVFEAGYFIGKIGIRNVIILHEEDVEIPSDLAGCVYVMLDSGDGWKEGIRKELAEMGLKCRY